MVRNKIKSEVDILMPFIMPRYSAEGHWRSLQGKQFET